MPGFLRVAVSGASLAFNHANLRWRLGPLEWLFVVPRYHFVHHAADQQLNDSNFGSVFTVWDRAFGTYKNPDHVPADFALGLDYETIHRIAAGSESFLDLYADRLRVLARCGSAGRGPWRGLAPVAIWGVDQLPFVG